MSSSRSVSSIRRIMTKHALTWQKYLPMKYLHCNLLACKPWHCYFIRKENFYCRNINVNVLS